MINIINIIMSRGLYPLGHNTSVCDSGCASKGDLLDSIWALDDDRFSLKMLCEFCRDNKQVVLHAMKKDGCSLQYASERLRDDTTVVEVAVREHGYALRYASNRMRENRDIVWGAAISHGMALRFAKSFQADAELILAAACVWPFSLEYASAELLEDRGFVLKASKLNWQCIHFVPESIREVIGESASTRAPPKHKHIRTSRTSSIQNKTTHSTDRHKHNRYNKTKGKHQGE